MSNFALRNSYRRSHAGTQLRSLEAAPAAEAELPAEAVSAEASPAEASPEPAAEVVNDEPVTPQHVATDGSSQRFLTMIKYSLCFAVVVVGVVVAAMQAQGPLSGPAQGPGPEGFGPPQGRPGPPPNSALAMITMPEVQGELKLSDDQRQKIDELEASFHEGMRSAFRDFGPSGEREGTSPEDRFAAMRDEMERRNRAFETKLFGLLDAQQKSRFQQLQLQREGVLALGKPELREKFKLTEQQFDELRRIHDASFSGFGPPRPSPEAQAKFFANLSDAQRAQWKELTGEEFKFVEVQPGGQFGRGPRGFGPGGFGGPGGPNREEQKLVKEFDQNGDGWLNDAERQVARKSSAARPQGRGGRGPGGFAPGGFGGPGRGREPGKPGPKVSPSDVEPLTNQNLYDTSVLRTIFIDFENDDWEAELEAFHDTDVEVPATLTVDGKKYSNVGIHFRGMSSYDMVPSGSKRSFNVSFDFLDDKQNLYGYKTLNLLNANGDPSFMNAVLYSQLAREHIPCPKANFVKVVVNGESWGVYVNQQQVDKTFIKENFGKLKGTRWKVPGRPNGDGGLAYDGDDVAEYQRRYEMKSNDGEAAWQALIKLCKTLHETPPDELEAALAPLLDIDETLWFLAFDNALINSDGYWTRASDYNLFLDETGKFHVIPHDINETFHAARGPGMGPPGGFGGGRGFGPPEDGFGPPRDGFGRRGEERFGGAPREGRFGGPRGEEDRERGERERGGRAGGGFALDPLVGLDDVRKPLRSKLLSVPRLREKYLANVREIAEKDLDWKKLGPMVAAHRALIEKEVDADTRKLSTGEAFRQAVAADRGDVAEGTGGHSLATFAKERRKYLLEAGDSSAAAR